jgi:flavin-dependent dehydrogenase
LGIPKEVLVGPQLFTVRVMDFDNNLDKFYQRHYINVDREKFDKWLVSLVPEKVDKLFSSRFSSFTKKEIRNQNIESLQDDLYEVDIISNGEKKKIKTKILIGADGANSKIRSLIIENNFKKYVSIQEWYEVKQTMPYFSSIFDKSVTDFYSWTIPKDNYLILGSAIPEGENISQKFNILKENLKNYNYDFGKKIKKEGTFIIRPQKLNQIFLGKNNIALIGEAAGLISPSSAEGISYAFKSANILAKSILKDQNKFLEIYKRDINKLKINIILKNLKSPFMYNKLMRNLVIKSGILSMNVDENEKL